MPSPKRSTPATHSTWVPVTRAEAAAYSAENKRRIKALVDAVIEQSMKPAVLRLRGKGRGFGDVLDLQTAWRGHSLVLSATRRGGRVAGRQMEGFITRSGRLTLVGVDRFDIAYFRPTGRWWTIARARDLKTALRYFKTPSPVWPW